MKINLGLSSALKIKTAMLLFIIKEQQSAFLLSIIQLLRENSERAHVLECIN